jgi:hypothetical protein
MKNALSSFSFLLFLFLLTISGFLYAQKFEGTLSYDIHYLPKSKGIKSKDLEVLFGNKEDVSIKNSFYKSERFYNEIPLKTFIYNNSSLINYIKLSDAAYWIKDLVSADIKNKINKLDSTAIIGSYKCDVYRFTKTALKVTYYVSSEKYAGNNPDNSWFTYPTAFHGPLVKLVVENPDYFLLQELSKAETKTIKDDVFETKNSNIFVSADDISNQILSPTQRKEIQHCLLKSIGYPGFLNLFNIEGKVWVEFQIDNAGTIKNTSVRADYFKKTQSISRIYNVKKIKHLEIKTSRKVLPQAQICLDEIKFDAALSENYKVSTIIRFPLVFNHYTADVVEENRDIDDYEIDDIYYDDFDLFY